MSHQPIPLEDFFEDVIGKTCRGLGIDDGTLSFITGVDEAKIVGLKNGEFDEQACRELCSTLSLDADALVAMAAKTWAPKPVDVSGLRQFHSIYGGDMGVNAYVAFDEATKSAAVFDTGADASELISTVAELGLKVEAVLITHTHHDHIIELDRVLTETGNPPCFVSDREPLPQAEGFAPGRTFQIGGLTISTRSTTGHSVGGVSYVIEGLSKPVVIVGDALFSSSMGGGVVSFPDALESNRRELFTLSDDCVVCPGHGPMSTIGEEKAHNPFYPEFK